MNMKSIRFTKIPSRITGFVFILLVAASPLFTASHPWGVGSCHIHGRSVNDYKNWVPEMKELNILMFAA